MSVGGDITLTDPARLENRGVPIASKLNNPPKSLQILMGLITLCHGPPIA
jgi:hypothetical protein